MSIDARVVGIRKVRSEYKLTLEDRPGGGLAGQETLRILNPLEMKSTPRWEVFLRSLIGCDIWGGAGEIMLGDKVFAKREGYTGIRLIPQWHEVVENHQKK